MPAAVAIPLITAAAGTGATLATAKMASNSAKNAAKQQQVGTNQALGLQRDIYTQTRQDQAPYRAIGSGALNSLGAMTGIPMDGQSQGPTLATMGQMGAPRSVGSGQTPAAAASAGGVVMMRAPDGTVKAVPRDQVAHFQQAGAQVVN